MSLLWNKLAIEKFVNFKLNLPITPVCPQPAENSTWSFALDSRFQLMSTVPLVGSGCTSGWIFSGLKCPIWAQLFSSYAKVGEARNLASVIGEDELSPIDKKYLAFGKEFEERYIGQGLEENRTIEETLDLGWELLKMLPREELDRIDTKILEQFYDNRSDS